jgi:phosphoribosylformylglycinamidine synthase
MLAPSLRGNSQTLGPIQRIEASGALQPRVGNGISSGGIHVVRLLEMAFASGCGLELGLEERGTELLAALFAEELGAVLQIGRAALPRVLEVLARHGLAEATHEVARPSEDARIVIRSADGVVCDESLATLRGWWSATSHAMQRLRDDPECADEEHAARTSGAPLLRVHAPFDFAGAPRLTTKTRPRLAILREQGVNGQIEMAAAFDRAGFECVDVHMTDVIERGLDLGGFRGLVACGGFSYGDVLGAGQGWAKSILFHPRARDAFARFFSRPETFALGVCNGCQMLSALKELVPGAAHWPRFVRNRSEQFEGRLVMVEIQDSPSLFFKGMAGSRMCGPAGIATCQRATGGPKTRDWRACPSSTSSPK